MSRERRRSQHPETLPNAPAKRLNSAAQWSLARQILSDHHGVWCAWCLGYIVSRTEMELHHVLAPKGEIHKTLGFEPWVVPVHRHPEVCHRKRLQQYANEAGRGLLDALNPEGFEERCKKSFDRGYLPASLLLRRNAWLKSPDYQTARQNLVFALNAAAGCGQGKSFVNEFECHESFIEFRADPDLQLYAASVHTNAGDPSRAASACDQLEATLSRVRPAGSLRAR